MSFESFGLTFNNTINIVKATVVQEWASAKNRELIKDLQKLRLMSDLLIHWVLAR